MRSGFRFGRGICPHCGREVGLTMSDLCRSHECPQHPLGYTQGDDPPRRILRHAVSPEEPVEVDHFWYRAGFGL